MDLWTALQGISPNYGPALLIFGIPVACAIVLAIVNYFQKTDLFEYFLLGAATVMALIGIVGGIFLAFEAEADARDQQSDLLADYLLDEHDLVVLDPIKYLEEVFCFFECPSPDDPQATTSAVAEDGTVVKVSIDWLDFSSKPHDPDVPLPVAFDPITVTITTPVK